MDSKRIVQQVMIVAAMVVMVLGGLGVTAIWAGSEVCDCPHPGDASGDGVIDILDIVLIVEQVFSSGPPIVWDPNCPKSRSDWNADGVLDVRDVRPGLVYIFKGVPGPVNPCDCLVNPPLCAPVVDPYPGTSGNTVAVESKTVFVGQTGVTIGIKLTNVVQLQDVVIPLVARSINPGSFINSVQMSFADRVTPSALAFARSRNLYADPNGTCSPQGFGTMYMAWGVARGTIPFLHIPLRHLRRASCSRPWDIRSAAERTWIQGPMPPARWS